MEFPNFVFEADCDFYSEFEALFELKGKDVSDDRLTYHGHQFEVIGNKLVDWKRLRDWTLEKIILTGITDIEILQSWGIDYRDHGYQAVHKHGIGSLSVVVSLDDQPSEGQTGNLYTVSAVGNGQLAHKEFKPRKGMAVIMSGGVYHGVYPCKNPRRTFVVDYKIKGVKDGI